MKLTTEQKTKLMGQQMLVNEVLEKTYTKNVVTWEPKRIRPRMGWIVGFRNRNLGRIIDHGIDESREWKGTGVLPCVMVTFSPSTNPEPVPLSELEAWENPLWVAPPSQNTRRGSGGQVSKDHGDKFEPQGQE